eukprot:1137202-Pelagomonas_calceolata.AAC.2
MAIISEDPTVSATGLRPPPPSQSTSGSNLGFNREQEDKDQALTKATRLFVPLASNLQLHSLLVPLAKPLTFSRSTQGTARPSNLALWSSRKTWRTRPVHCTQKRGSVELLSSITWMQGWSELMVDDESR